MNDTFEKSEVLYSFSLSLVAREFLETNESCFDENPHQLIDPLLCLQTLRACFDAWLLIDGWEHHHLHKLFFPSSCHRYPAWGLTPLLATHGRKLSHMPILGRLGEIDYGKITLFLDSDMAECLGPTP